MNNSRLFILYALFIGLLVGMNLLGTKIVPVPYLNLAVSVGIFMVPITFLITDIVEEVYGMKIVKHFITGGVLTLFVIFAYTAFFVNLPPHERFVNNKAYVVIFGSSLRIMIASVTAFYLAQMHDVVAFEWWKKKTKGKALWLRNTASTAISQFIDTFVFMMIAFYMVTPKFTFGFIVSLIIPYYLFKLAFAVIDTPFVYLGVDWLKAGERKNRKKQ